MRTPNPDRLLGQRIYTALAIIGAFLFALFYVATEIFCILMAFVVCLASWEWSSLSSLQLRVTRFAYVLSLAVLLVLAGYALGLHGDGAILNLPAKSLMQSACIWWVVALFLVLGYPSSAALWGNRPMHLLMGWLALVPAWSAIVVLLHQENGRVLLLLAILVVVLADTGAYFTGRRFGKCKLAPKVSPGKTWEGFFGGLVANSFLLLVLELTMKLDLQTFLKLAALVLAASCASVLGDLFESMVKRQIGVKDSGSILPGHGGILDRIDGLAAALPVFTLLFLNLIAVK